MNIPSKSLGIKRDDRLRRTGPLQPSNGRQFRMSVQFKAVAAILLLSLGACSGSDFEELGSAFADHVGKEVFGIDPEDPKGLNKPGEREARARDFARRADTLAATSAWAGTRPVATAACAQTRCLWTGTTTVGGEQPERTISDLFPADISGVATEVVENGPVSFSYQVSFDGRRSDGYWMTHSIFGYAGEPGWLQGGTSARFGFAGGDMTGSRPSASATWTGNMLGIAVATGIELAGDAALTWSAAEPDTVDVAIDNIHLNWTAEPWSVGSVPFDDVPLSASGTFGWGTSGNLIRGSFNGPDHAEVAGAFEKHGIIGGFGAQRK